MPSIAERLTLFLRHYLAALQQFTRVPVDGPLAARLDLEPDLLRAHALHLPGVGLLIGMAACVVFAVVSLGLPNRPLAPLAAAVLSLAAVAWLTGGLHEAGLARLADDLGGSTARTLTLGLVLACKATLLAVLASESAGGVLAALLAAHVVSRFWPLLLLDPMPPPGGATVVTDTPLPSWIDRRALALAGLWCVLPLGLMVATGQWLFMLFALGATALAWAGLRRVLRQRGRAMTLANFGATQQACEVAFYLGAAIGFGR